MPDGILGAIAKGLLIGIPVNLGLLAIWICKDLIRVRRAAFRQLQNARQLRPIFQRPRMPYDDF